MALDYKQKKVQRRLGQGIKVFHDDPEAEVDIIAVPGLGTNPEECWTCDLADNGSGRRAKRAETGRALRMQDVVQMATQQRSFNWIRDPDGIASLPTKSRIMLYDYASAWQGQLKVRATIKSICTVLLDDLMEKRKGATEVTRPLILIGHSMGGVVIAKALCMAKARREYESIMTCTMGCLFFGTPFRGAEMAKMALLYSSVFGNEAYEALLTLMRAEHNDGLDEIREDFVELCGKLNPPIDVLCVYEEIETNISYGERTANALPSLLQHKFFTASARKLVETGVQTFTSGTHFVEKESAILENSHSFGLTADHKRLIHFQSLDDPKFMPVKAKLRAMVDSSKLNVRRRHMSLGHSLLSQRFVVQIREALEGPDMRSRFRGLAPGKTLSSWITSEPWYQQWVKTRSGSDSGSSYIWLRGGPGIGKTNAALTAIQHLGQRQSEETHLETARDHCETFLAFFICEKSTSWCTAEDLLKSLISQLIAQEESLAQHAKWFVPDARKHHWGGSAPRLHNSDGSGGNAKATATVDNLWKVLKDIIDDPVVDNVHFIISNVHLLDTGDSTRILLAKWAADTVRMQGNTVNERKAKWLITSRSDRHIQDTMQGSDMLMINLEDREFGSKVKQARQQRAREAVQELKTRKRYNPELAWYIRNTIENESVDEKWIDLLCLLLGGMSDDSGSAAIRDWLREYCQLDTDHIVARSWKSILSRNEDVKLQLEELMRILTILYEPPTLSELALFIDDMDEEQIADLIGRCAPLLQCNGGESKDRITFAQLELLECLSAITYGQGGSGAAQKKRWHGYIAIKCFNFVRAFYGQRPQAHRAMSGPSDMRRTPSVMAKALQEADVLLIADEDEALIDFQDTAPPPGQPSVTRCSYAIKYLMRHLGEGGSDVADDFDDLGDQSFWGQSSMLRDAWLADFRTLTRDFQDIETDEMSALHIAAGIGAQELVAILVGRCGKEALAWEAANGMTALHVAAHSNYCEVVETLIRAGSDLEAGDGQTGTPLHLAARKGNKNVIKLLLQHGSSVNACSEKFGPVINAAISSNNVEAVELIMEHDVHFDLDYTRYDPPLSLSAGISEPKIFQSILNIGKEKWLQNVKLVDQALVAASDSSQCLESVQILLQFEHYFTWNTIHDALLAAALAKNWRAVSVLLDYVMGGPEVRYGRDLPLHEIFYLAAASREERIDLMERIWNFTNRLVPQPVIDYSLYQAAVLNKSSTVIWLLQHCQASANAGSSPPISLLPDASEGPIEYWNALNAAASSGNLRLVEALVDAGAVIDGDYDYSLQLAAAEGQLHVVNFLLVRGAHVNRIVPDGNELNFRHGTALQAACDRYHPMVVDALIAHEADPNLGGSLGTRPILVATQKAQPDLLEALLTAPDIDVNVEEEGSTAIINAAAHMSMDMVKKLLDKGADVNAKDAAGDTPLTMAAARGDKDCVELLCNAGADVTYRSPRRGLAIQIAASGNHALCAHTLAEKMGGTIEDYREQVKIDPSKERLDQALLAITDRDNEIERLTGMLTDSKEQMDAMQKTIHLKDIENHRLMSNASLQGETYESMRQQVQAKEAERVELTKQLEAARGQASLATATMSQMQLLLDEEKAANHTLRQGKTYVALQEARDNALEEKRIAHELFEREKAVSVERAELERQMREDLALENQKLRDMIEDLEAAVEARMSEREAADLETKIERLKREGLEEQIRTKEEELMSISATLSAAQEAVSRKLEKSPEPKPIPAPEDDDLLADLYQSHANAVVRDQPERSMSDTAVLNANIASAKRNATSPVIGSTDYFAVPRKPIRSPTEGLPQSGFRTLHGQHRSNGALGGFRTDRTRARRQQTQESLNSDSTANGGDPQSPDVDREYVRVGEAGDGDVSGGS